jgi:hypothetical protein
MTEREWLECADPRPMLEFLRGQASERKLRLFACACCRAVWALLTDQRSRQAVEVAERYADGLVGAETLAAASQAAWKAWVDPASSAACDVADGDPALAAAEASKHASWASQRPLRADEFQVQAHLLRDIIANPFRALLPRPFSPPCAESLAGSIARVIYEEHRFGDLPVLADALEEAGCADAELLAHLRAPGPHIRGCWALDLVLGRN